MANKVKVGVVGCGDIAHRSYLPSLTGYSQRCEVTAVCDLNPERARLAAEKFGIPTHYGEYDRFLSEADVEMVVVLTINPAHAANTLAALQAGKHVCCEKMLANTVAVADEIIQTAQQRDRKLVVAPAVLVDPAVARVGQLIQDGAVGKICLVRAHATGAGPAHYFGYFSDPTWFYQHGTGPLRDNGVYPLTTITGLLGPAQRVTALVGTCLPEVTLRVGPRAGETIPVESPDNYTLLLDFGEGSFAYVDASYCVRGQRPSPMEIFGATGSLSLWHRWHDGPRVEYYHDDPRLGIAGWVPAVRPNFGKDWDFAWSARYLVDCLYEDKDVQLLTAEHHRHVIEIMEQAEVSSSEGRAVALETIFTRPTL